MMHSRCAATIADRKVAALHEAHDALEGYEEAIEADHNSVGSVKLV